MAYEINFKKKKNGEIRKGELIITIQKYPIPLCKGDLKISTKHLIHSFNLTVLQFKNIGKVKRIKISISNQKVKE
jgi:hypothetical protein